MPDASGQFSLNPVTDFQRLTAFPFMVHALQAGFVVAVMAGLIGWFVVLRGESFAAHTLSLMAFPGGAGALLLGLPASAGYLVASAGTGLILALSRGRAPARAGGEQAALTGTVQALGLACGFLFLSLYQGILGGYETLLFGDLLGITRGQVLALSVTGGLVLILLALAGRPLLFASVDRAVARAAGVPVRGLGAGFLVLMGAAVAATAQITGALLVFALLVAPPATAQLLTSRIAAGLLLAVGLAVLTVWLGLALAYFLDLPVGFPVSSLAFVGYLLARIRRAMAAGAGTRPLVST